MLSHKGAAGAFDYVFEIRMGAFVGATSWKGGSHRSCCNIRSPFDSAFVGSGYTGMSEEEYPGWPSFVVVYHFAPPGRAWADTPDPPMIVNSRSAAMLRADDGPWTRPRVWLGSMYHARGFWHAPCWRGYAVRRRCSVVRPAKLRDGPRTFCQPQTRFAPQQCQSRLLAYGPLAPRWQVFGDQP